MPKISEKFKKKLSLFPTTENAPEMPNFKKNIFHFIKQRIYIQLEIQLNINALLIYFFDMRF
ncbi:hypothetical protein DXC40_07175 [Anaerotruncus colihominis]|uniref:Uncharacterized protein n=1 Tax=Anaerotruncus colihominis TaxID=169435 RepID=A0A3E3IM21_9FIRM|nr:hypothetical protein DXC40_07175 [Anaerotruncus colihominis]